ncbi:MULTISPECIES: alpha-amylase family glycosyl hydrolase [unclassified Lentimonas]|uniref:alpha-amylase family glycosyl hydrolase n=1 Tax=unclassified Lentimonas TaxID=2630993 RepID=UPI00132BF5EB|nr:MULTISPECIES: alpha-amylase family glycosyl hydrolase [unclassified Lentimonas]CAA6678018.1 Glycosyltransferase [Lentimonas sp. CC4]CAA6686992.1 Glycosyltransferase [Lentimonas sp. CC6]CAA7075835.1 Glycosyltransferase [Lentimonas sp. CC4]CAA7172039.1 Glycosyltransferase [Lentimonas sp. CC21]CAA7182898.1 Glycosyltransferase [Lentimonas sp. CC8]
MGDFHQHGQITTLHQLNKRPLEKLEADLMEFKKRRPMGLVLPSLYSELQGPALSSIVDQIAQVPYLDQVVVGLDRANQEEYQHALEFFSRLPQQPEVLWNDGPRLRKIDALLKEKGLAPKEMGKGRNVWYMFGYVLAAGKAEAVALHDCDITTYDREMLARLIYPVANPSFSYKFCKGFYARVAGNSMNGRVCRLLVTPLLRALRKVCGPNDYLEYLDSFRYPLAGEFSMQRDVIEDIRIPSDWGLEMGVLSEMQRNYATNQICQVDIADTYDHKHQDLSLEDRSRGLSKMSCDITKSLYRKMATQGEVFSAERIRTIKAAYYRIALDLVESYHNDAQINGLSYDRHTEGSAVEVFAENIMQAGVDFLNPENSMDVPFMPSWKRVISAVPDILDQLVQAVEDDRQEFGQGAVLNPALHPKAQRVRQRVALHVEEIYGAEDTESITDKLFEAANMSEQSSAIAAGTSKWDQSDVMMITYGDSILQEGKAPLQSLHHFLRRELKNTISGVHILPFNPYSSDDGFSVIDYLAVNKELGHWGDIEAIGKDFNLMADLVINHCSSESLWFKNFLEDREPGRGYFVEGDNYPDITKVIRPRSSPLLTSVKTVKGKKEVWCTFSPDQVDLDFSNPEVLLEIVRVIREYVNRGIRFFRLDAIAFLWKKSGTSCVHLPQTHELIKLLRLVIENLEPTAVVITETNVPNRENLSYFGNDNEAHLIYNFSLPPLLVHALLSGNSKHLKVWMMSMPPARRGRAYLNFIASHDGIGLRPAEGLLSETELDGLVDVLRDSGGEISMRQAPGGGLKPYEANISLYSAMARTIGGEADGLQMARFLCAHTVMLALEGLPAVYIHSMLGTENDRAGVALTGRARSINRHRWDAERLQETLVDTQAHNGAVFAEMKRLIQIRRDQEAFHPNATQYTLHFGNQIFAFWRESLNRDQSIFALHNMSDQPQTIPLVELNLIATELWTDLLSGTSYDDLEGTIELPPYGCVWISNRS